MLLDIYDSKKINLVSIFFILCCFPWVSFSTNELDSQPWVILLGSAVLLIDKNKKIPKYMLTAFILTIFGLVLSIYKTMTSAPAALEMTSWIIRSIANYGTFYVVLIISWNAFSRGYDKLKLIKIVKLSNYIYYLFAIIEINSPTIVEFLGNSRPSGGRGLTSLTPEPTSFAIFLIFSSLLIFAARGFSFKEDRITHFLNIIGVIFIAQSATGILILSIIFLGNIIRKLLKLKISKRDALLLALVFIILSNILPLILEIFPIQSRAYSLFLKFLKNPENIYLVDYSIRTRVGNIFVSLYIAFSKYLIPQGIVGLKYIASEYSDIFDGVFSESRESKIMSWTGDWIFTIGIFGISSLSIFFFKIRDRIYSSVQYYFLAVFFVISFTAIPVSFPFSAILISLLLTNNKEKSLIIQDV